MPGLEPQALWHLTQTAGPESGRFIADSAGRAALGNLLHHGTIARSLTRFRGKSLLVWCKRQRAVIETLLQLDGIAARLVLCPSDFDVAHLAPVIAEAEIDAIVTDSTALAEQARDAKPIVFVENEARYVLDLAEQGGVATEWVLFTSGTSDRPKLVAHNLASLTGPLDDFHRQGARRGMEHLLRHSPLWRAADPAARTGRRRVTGALASRRAGRGVPRSRRRGRRHAYFGHTLALAPRADERRGGPHRAALCAFVG
jgi:non-ribosomal peptide synthetase component F